MQTTPRCLLNTSCSVSTGWLSTAFSGRERVAALFLAGRAFVRYRRQGGTQSNVLGDFFIGAHATVSRYPLLTRDTRRYSSDFTDVKLIAPEIAT